MFALPEKELALMDQLCRRGIPFLFVVSFDGRKAHVWEKGEIPEEIRFSVPSLRGENHHGGLQPENFNFELFPPSFDTYLESFRKVMSHIERGDTYLINLTMPSVIRSSLSLSQIYEFSKAPYKLLFGREFVCFSPEIFVRITGNTISSYPMKGTIDASLPKAEELILTDKKETAEHNTIVDLIRNDLSIVAENVRVTRYRYIDRIETNRGPVLQVSSEISGEIKPEYMRKAGTILSHILPAGSITGAPKGKTVEILQEAEGYQRGYYTGVFGWFDGKNLDSGVMIRFIEQQDEGLVYKSGGGITFLSDARSEYEELIKKVYVPFS